MATEEVGRNKDPGASLSDRIDAALMDVHTALPGRILDYNATTQRASVQIQLKREFQRSDGTREEIPIPPLRNVPVLFPRAGGYSITFPVAVNNPCLVVFLERNAKGWIQNGQAAVPPTARKHDYSDAVAILGLYPTPNALSPAASTSALSLRNDAGTKKIEISSGGIVVTSDGAVVVGSGTDVTITADDDITIVADDALNLVATGIGTIAAGAALSLSSVAAMTLTPTGPFVVASTGAVTITRGPNELLSLISQALDKIGTSTVGGSPLSNAADIAALKVLVDAMRV